MVRAQLYWLAIAVALVFALYLILSTVVKSVVLSGIRRQLAHLSGTRDDGPTPNVNADIRFLSLRWNGWQTKDKAYFSLVVLDPQLSLVSSPAAATAGSDCSGATTDKTSNSEARPTSSTNVPQNSSSFSASAIAARFSDLEAQITTMTYGAARRYKLGRCLKLAFTALRFCIVIYSQTVLLPLLAALLDIDISRLSITWTLAPAKKVVDSDQARLPPSITHLRIRHIQLGWRARSGSLRTGRSIPGSHVHPAPDPVPTQSPWVSQVHPSRRTSHQSLATAQPDLKSSQTPDSIGHRSSTSPFDNTSHESSSAVPPPHSGSSDLTLCLNLSVTVSWSDVHVFVERPAGEHVPKQGAMSYLDPLWTFECESKAETKHNALSWANSYRDWVADGNPSSSRTEDKILQPDIARVLFIPGTTSISLATLVTTSFDTSALRSRTLCTSTSDSGIDSTSASSPNAVPSDSPSAQPTQSSTFVHEGTKPADSDNRNPLRQNSKALTSTTTSALTIRKGPMTLNLSGGRLAAKLAPMVINMSATMELVRQIKTLEGARQNSPTLNQQSQSSRHQPGFSTFTGKTATTQVKADKHPRFARLIDGITIEGGGVRALHTVSGSGHQEAVQDERIRGPEPDATKTRREVEGGAVIAAHMGKFSAQLSDFDMREKQHKVAGWARSLTRLTRRPRSHIQREGEDTRDIAASLDVRDVRLHVYPVASSGDVPYGDSPPIGQIQDIQGRLEGRFACSDERPPLINAQLNIHSAVGQWLLPPEAAADPLAQGCTALASALLSMAAQRQATTSGSDAQTRNGTESQAYHDPSQRLGRLSCILATHLPAEVRAGVRIHDIKGTISAQRSKTITFLAGSVQGLYGNITLLPSSKGVGQSYGSVQVNAGAPHINVDLSENPSGHKSRSTYEYSLVDVLGSSCQGEFKATATTLEHVPQTSVNAFGPPDIEQKVASTSKEDGLTPNYAELDVDDQQQTTGVRESTSDETIRTHLEGNLTGTVRAVRARLDNTLAWNLLQHLAAGGGRLVSVARDFKARATNLRETNTTPKSKRNSQLLPTTAKSSDVLNAPDLDASSAYHEASFPAYIHTHKVYTCFNVLDFDGRCAASDPKRQPFIDGPHAHEGILYARGHQVRDHPNLPKMNREEARHRRLAKQASRDAEGLYVGTHEDIHPAPFDVAGSTGLADDPVKKNHSSTDPKDLSAAERAEIVATAPPAVPPLLQEDIVDDRSNLPFSQRKAQDDRIDANPSPLSSSYTTAYHLPPFCAPLPPARAGVTGLRAICSRWRLESVAIQMLKGQDTAEDDQIQAGRAKLGLQPDALDDCLAHARGVGSTALLRSTVFDFSLAAVDPISSRQKKSRRDAAGPEAGHPSSQEGNAGEENDGLKRHPRRAHDSHGPELDNVVPQPGLYDEPPPDDGPTAIRSNSGRKGKHMSNNPHAIPEQKPFEILHVPVSMFTLNVAPEDFQEQSCYSNQYQGNQRCRNEEQLALPHTVTLAWNNPEPVVLSIELANTYVLLMVVSGFRRVLQAANDAMGPATTSNSTDKLDGQSADTRGRSEPDPDEGSQQFGAPKSSDKTEKVGTDSSPKRPKRKLLFTATFSRIDIPILLTNGLRMYVGVREVKQKQRLFLPLPKMSLFDPKSNGSLVLTPEEYEEIRSGLSSYHIEFDKLLTAVYHQKMGLWQPTKQFEWAEFLSWNKASIIIDWPSMPFPPPSNSPSPWNGAAINWDDDAPPQCDYDVRAAQGCDGDPLEPPNIQGFTNSSPRAPPAKRLPPLLLTGESVLMTIPFGFIFHDIVTGASVGVKATKQLMHEAVMGDLAYQVSPSVMKPLPLPPIRLRLCSFVIEFEDNPIDSHLLMIQQTGAMAAKGRLMREVAFHERAQKDLAGLLSKRRNSNIDNEEHCDFRHAFTEALFTPAGGQSVSRLGSEGLDEHSHAGMDVHEAGHTNYDPDISGSSAPQSDFSSESLDFDHHSEGEQEATQHRDGAAPALQAFLNTVKSARYALDKFESSEWVRLTDKAIKETRNAESRTKMHLENPTPVQELKDRLREGNATEEYGDGEKDYPKWLVRMRTKTPKVALFRSVMTHVDMRVSQPHTFVATDTSTRDYINTFGDPIPKDLMFSIFIPLHFELDVEEWLASLRDFPLPLVHVIPDKSGPFSATAPLDESAIQGRAPSFQLVTEMVITEQMGHEPSTRHLAACIVHHDCQTECGSGYVLQIPKVTMPTKIFGHPVARIHSKHPFQLTWGHSMSPAMSELSKVVDGFSSPPVDPSPKPGFWDKLPLILHGDFELLVDKPSQVQLFLKGSRNPYDVRGHGSGWVMIWSEGVRCTVGKSNAAHELIQVLSGEYKLAIPDLNVFACPASVTLVTLGTIRNKEETRSVNTPIVTATDEVLQDEKQKDRHQILFPPLPLQKIAWALKGDVVWGAGFVLERTCDRFSCIQEPKCSSSDPFYRKCRFWDHVSHWQVVTRTPQYIESLPDDAQRDSYAGWRHDHVHFSISVKSRSGNVDNPNRANSLHVTPLTSAHFWAWIHLFNSALSLPIRMGPLYGSIPSQSAGFGKHCATIKYRFDIKPFVASHVYLQHDAGRHQRGANLFLGLKVRVDDFNFDVHQRQQETFVENKALGTSQKTLHKPVNATELDLSKAEMRVIAAEVTDLERVTHAIQAGFGDIENNADTQALDAFLSAGPDESTDERSSWWDYRDFVEIGTRIGRDPEKRSTVARTETILECPAFCYVRKTRTRQEVEATMKADRKNAEQNEDKTASGLPTSEPPRYINLGAYGHSKFGNEGTHYCLMGESSDPQTVQASIAQARIDELRRNGPPNKRTSDAIAILKEFQRVLPSHTISTESSGIGKSYDDDYNLGQNKIDLPDEDPMSIPNPQLGDEASAQRKNRGLRGAWNRFNNRYVMHCPVVRFTDSTRNIVHRYYISNQMRRGQAHYLRASALQSIRNLRLNEKHGLNSPQAEDYNSNDPNNVQSEGAELLRALLNKAVKVFEGAEEPPHTRVKSHAPLQVSLEDVYRGINPDLEVRFSTILVLLRPQFILQSDVDDKSTVVLSSMRIRMSNFAVFDPNYPDSDVNARILNRNSIVFEQMKGWSPKSPQNLVLPMETLLDERDQVDCEEGSTCRQIASQTDFILLYDHFNQLRLSTDVERLRETKNFPSDQVHLLYHMDLVRLFVPPFTISADREQFSAIYNVCTDLMLYQDPSYRQRQERLKTLLLAYDFTDSENLAQIVALLHLRIGVLYQVHEEFEARYGDLTEEDRLESGRVFGELRDLIDELSLFMDAIKAAQDQQAGHDQEQKNALMLELRLADVKWRMIKSEDVESPLQVTQVPSSSIAELHVEKSSFIWLNKADSSTANALVIADINAQDPRPDAIFPSIISKYKGEQASNHYMLRQGRFFQATWQALAPVAGISIIDHFELDIHPLDVQLELEVGREIMRYAFSTKEENDKAQREEAEEAEHVKHESHQGVASGLFKRLHDDESINSLESDRDSVDTRNSSRPKRGSTSENHLASLTPKGSKSKTKQKQQDATLVGMEQNLFGDMDELDDNTMRVAAEMRERSVRNRSFVYVQLPHTIFCLSFRGDNKLIDMYGSVFQTPAFEFGNSVGSMEDLVNHFKRSVIQAAWNQKSTIIKGFLRYRPRQVSKRLSARKKIRGQAERARSKQLGQVHEDSESPVSSEESESDNEGASHSPMSNEARLTSLQEEPLQSVSSSGHDSTGLKSSRGASEPDLSRVDTAKPALVRNGRIPQGWSQVGDDADSSRSTRTKSSVPNKDSSSPNRSNTNLSRRKHRISRIFTSAFHSGA